MTDHALPAAIGRYEILERLGEGGMGEVFLARTRGVQGFEKPVVVKRLLPKLAHSPKLVSLFVAEAKLAARLQHRNVVQVHDLGEDNGSLYIVMEYVAGTDLAHLLRTTVAKNVALPVWFSLHAAIEMLGGLACLHDATDERGRRLNAVHRDVSPANVFVSFSGDVKLGDFGVAKSELRDDQTRAGEVRGKIAYLSPEQIIGRNFDARADLFSAAIVLWECLAQRRLFGGRPDYQSILAITQGPRPPPSEYNPRVTPELDALLARALSVDPNDRFQSALELQRAIADIQQKYQHVVVGTDVRDLLLRLSANAKMPPDAPPSEKSVARRTTLSPIATRAKKGDDHTRSLSEIEASDEPPVPQVIAGPVESMPKPTTKSPRVNDVDAAVSAAVSGGRAGGTASGPSVPASASHLPGLGVPPPPPPSSAARTRTVTPLPGSLSSPSFMLPAGRLLSQQSGMHALGPLPGPDTGIFPPGTFPPAASSPAAAAMAAMTPPPAMAPITSAAMTPAAPPLASGAASFASTGASQYSTNAPPPPPAPPGVTTRAPAVPPFGAPQPPAYPPAHPGTVPPNPPYGSYAPGTTRPPAPVTGVPFAPPAAPASSVPFAAPLSFGAPPQARPSGPPTSFDLAGDLTGGIDPWKQLGLERDYAMSQPVKPGAMPHAAPTNLQRPSVQVVMGQAVAAVPPPATDLGRIVSVADSRAAPHTPPWVHLGMVPGSELDYPPGTVHDGGYRGPSPFWLKNQDDLYWGPVGWPELAGYLANGLERSAHHLMASADGQGWMDLEHLGALLGVESWCVRAPSSIQGRLRGNLRRRSLTSVLAALWRNRETGRLVLSAEDPLTDAWRELHVIEGVPTFVTSNAPRVSLLDLLAKQHLLRPDDLPRVVHTAVQERVPVELAARKRGLIDVDQNLPLVVRERAVELFGWRLGQFVFEQGYMPLRVRPIAKSCLALATMALLRASAERELLHDIGNHADKKLAPTARFDQSLLDLGFNDVQVEVARLLAKGHTINALMRKDGVDKKALALVSYILVEAELLVSPRA